MAHSTTQSTRVPRKLAVAALFVFFPIMSLTVSVFAGSSGAWTTTGSLSTARTRHTATLLANGQVLVAGGFNSTGVLISAELYDPSTGKWTVTGSMNVARWGHTATLLPNGDVLVAGGSTVATGSAPTAEAELYNPFTGKWRTTGSMKYNRDLHGAALLANGQVLVAGGDSKPTYPGILTAELYNPATGKWTMTGTLQVGHIDQQAALLQDGRVFASGETIGEIYSNGTWTSTSPSIYILFISRAALLTNGDVLVVGGARRDNLEEFYNPAMNTWTTTGRVGISGLDYGPLTRLINGKVLVAGGQQVTYAGIVTTNQCSLYDTSTNSWARTGSMSMPRSDHTTTLLPGGRVLAVGGATRPSFRNTALASAELYSP